MEMNAKTPRRQVKTPRIQFSFSCRISLASWRSSFLSMSWLLVHLVLLYRVTLGRLLGGQCRFHPTCSQYAIDAINKHGPWRGSWLTIKRIARCHPWGGSGYDPA